MNKLIELGNRYAKASDWKDFAMVKFCLCAMGVIIGVNIPKKDKQIVTDVSLLVFGVTYGALMGKVFRIAKEMMAECDCEE